MEQKDKSPIYYHSPFLGNPHKNGVINVSTDVPRLPIQYRSQSSLEASVRRSK